MSKSAEEVGNRILFYTFNQTSTFLYIATTRGFRIVRLEDNKITSKRDRESEINFPVSFTQGGFQLIAPMFSTQLLSIVGSPYNTRYPPNRVLFWDEFACEMKGEIRFRTEIKNLLIRRDKVVIVLDKIVPFTQTYVYLLTTLKPIASIPTVNNEKGVCAISYDKDRFVLVTLDTEPGNIRIENFHINEVKRGAMHENPISHLSLNYAGTHGASASEQGTIIRVFDTMTLDILHELRRGTSPANITCLTFSPDQKYILACSNRPTIHVWDLQQNQQSGFSSMFGNYLPNYFRFDRSYASVAIEPEIKWVCPSTMIQGPIACFTSEDEFCVAALDGLVYKCRIGEGNIEIQAQMPYLDFEGETVVEGERQWSSFD